MYASVYHKGLKLEQANRMVFPVRLNEFQTYRQSYFIKFSSSAGLLHGENVLQVTGDEVT
jgi:hypothetical protein